MSLIYPMGGTHPLRELSLSNYRDHCWFCDRHMTVHTAIGVQCFGTTTSPRSKVESSSTGYGTWLRQVRHNTFLLNWSSVLLHIKYITYSIYHGDLILFKIFRSNFFFCRMNPPSSIHVHVLFFILLSHCFIPFYLCMHFLFIHSFWFCKHYCTSRVPIIKSIKHT